MRTYFTLIERTGNGPWQIAFGDYSRDVVADEMRDMQDAERIDRTGRRFRIIRTSDKQAAIDAAVAKLNQAHAEGGADEYPQ